MAFVHAQLERLRRYVPICVIDLWPSAFFFFVCESFFVFRFVYESSLSLFNYAYTVRPVYTVYRIPYRTCTVYPYVFIWIFTVITVFHRINEIFIPSTMTTNTTNINNKEKPPLNILYSILRFKSNSSLHLSTS